MLADGHCKHMAVNNEKHSSPFSDTVAQKIDFTTYDFHRDHPQVWELKLKLLAYMTSFSVL